MRCSRAFPIDRMCLRSRRHHALTSALRRLPLHSGSEDFKPPAIEPPKKEEEPPKEKAEPPKEKAEPEVEDAPLPLPKTLKPRKPKAKGRKLPSKTLLAARAKEEVRDTIHTISLHRPLSCGPRSSHQLIRSLAFFRSERITAPKYFLSFPALASPLGLLWGPFSRHVLPMSISPLARWTSTRIPILDG